MDSDEMAAFAAELGRAVGEGLAAGSGAQERSNAEAANARDLAKRRQGALNKVVRRFERERVARVDAVRKAVDGYCAAAYHDALEALKSDRRMPRTINYLERYEALLGMQDRGDVLRRIEATLDLADRILDAVERVDVQGAANDAARMYVEQIMGLDGICVSQAGPDSGSGLGVVEEEAPSAAGGFDIAAVIGDAFADVMDSLPALEAAAAQELEAAMDREKTADGQIALATKTATKAAAVACAAAARSVAGAALEVERPSDFVGEVSAKLVGDPAAMRLLASEVRASFGTFSQVVRDNGLFAAFSNESSYGACRYSYSYEGWWSLLDDDGDADESRDCRGIPTAVEEDEGGDTLEGAIERMRIFNQRDYFGLLDDDFQQHVEAFWYGFKSLMAGVNGLYEVDIDALAGYCSRIRLQIVRSAADLAVRMDVNQVDALVAAVQALGKKGGPNGRANL